MQVLEYQNEAVKGKLMTESGRMLFYLQIPNTTLLNTLHHEEADKVTSDEHDAIC